MSVCNTVGLTWQHLSDALSRLHLQSQALVKEFLEITLDGSSYKTNLLTRAIIRLVADAIRVQWPRGSTKGMGSFGQSRLPQSTIDRLGAPGLGNFGALEHIAGYSNMHTSLPDGRPWSTTGVRGSLSATLRYNQFQREIKFELLNYHTRVEWLEFLKQQTTALPVNLLDEITLFISLG